MVTTKVLFVLCAITGITYTYPIHMSHEDPSSPMLYHLATRSPNPTYEQTKGFKTPFDVNQFLRNLDYKIPGNKDIQEWVKEADKKGAMAAEGNFSEDDKDDNKSEDEEDDDNDDDDKQDPKGEDHQHGANYQDGNSMNQNEQPIQSQQPAPPAGIENSFASNNAISSTASTPTTTVYVPVPVLATHYVNIPDIDANDQNSASPIPIFPQPTATVPINTSTSPSPPQKSSVKGPQVSDSSVAHQTITESSTSATSTEASQPSLFGKLSHLVDLVTGEDQSEPSYR